MPLSGMIGFGYGREFDGWPRSPGDGEEKGGPTEGIGRRSRGRGRAQRERRIPGMAQRDLPGDPHPRRGDRAGRASQVGEATGTLGTPGDLTMGVKPGYEPDRPSVSLALISKARAMLA